MSVSGKASASAASTSSSAAAPAAADDDFDPFADDTEEDVEAAASCVSVLSLPSHLFLTHMLPFVQRPLLL